MFSFHDFRSIANKNNCHSSDSVLTLPQITFISWADLSWYCIYGIWDEMDRLIWSFSYTCIVITPCFEPMLALLWRLSLTRPVCRAVEEVCIIEVVSRVGRMEVLHEAQ